jgi:hypothetical protein
VLLERLEPLREGGSDPVDPEVKAGLESDLKVWRGCEIRRKMIVKEMWGVISEAVGNAGQSNDEIRELQVIPHFPKHAVA